MPITKEQEAIEKLEYYLKNSAYKRENSDFFKNGGWEIVDLEIPKAIETVLNMLKEKDIQINSKNGTINALQCVLKERTEERDRKDNIVTKQNKIIDLMADFISKYHCFELMVYDLDDKCMHERECKECIKQYFERKSDK